MLSPYAACLMVLVLTAPVAAETPRPADRAAKTRAVEELIRDTQSALDRARAGGQPESWPQRSARRSLALARELLSIGNARVAESMALEARRVLASASPAAVHP